MVRHNSAGYFFIFEQLEAVWFAAGGAHKRLPLKEKMVSIPMPCYGSLYRDIVKIMYPGYSTP